jgi:hypothetical protein
MPDDIHPPQKHVLARPGNWPLIFLAIALLLGLVSHGLEIYWQRDTLLTLRQNQEPQIQAASKVRTQLDSIAREIAVLAGRGNANARLVIDELGKRGILINPNAAPVQPPGL